MKTREQAEARALELYPLQSDTQGDYIYGERRKAYLQCWEDMKVAIDAKQAADEVDRDKHTCGFCVKQNSLHLSP